MEKYLLSITELTNKETNKEIPAEQYELSREALILIHNLLQDMKNIQNTESVLVKEITK